jgi:hypothetical protein
LTVRNAEEDAIRAHFAAAHFDWDNLLGPIAFLEWRSGLARKTDHVAGETDPATGAPRDFTIRTSTDDGALREASLTIEAAGMLPVNARFVFADREWVEVSATSDAKPEASAPANLPVHERAAAVAAAQKGQLESAAARELKVRAAIDALQGDAAEHVTVDALSDGAIAVTPYHLAADQEQKLRASLALMAGVTVLPAPDTMRDLEPDPARATAADVIVDAGQSIAAQAHILAQLDQRFHPAAQFALAESGRRTLAQLRARHAARLVQKIDLLWLTLHRDRPEIQRPVAEAGIPDTEVAAAAIVNCAEAVNRGVMNLYAAPAPEPGLSSRSLTGDLATLTQLTGRYSRQLEREAAR